MRRQLRPESLHVPAVRIVDVPRAGLGRALGGEPLDVGHDLPALDRDLPTQLPRHSLGADGLGQDYHRLPACYRVSFIGVSSSSSRQKRSGYLLLLD
jgi:hypothetical protein